MQKEGYLRRKIDTYLDDWKSAPRGKPLIVRGARQVGKTEAIMQFATRNSYSGKMNLLVQPSYSLSMPPVRVAVSSTR